MPAVMDIKFIERMKGDMSLVSQFYDDPAAGIIATHDNDLIDRAQGWKVVQLT